MTKLEQVIDEATQPMNGGERGGAGGYPTMNKHSILGLPYHGEEEAFVEEKEHLP